MVAAEEFLGILVVVYSYSEIIHADFMVFKNVQNKTTRLFRMIMMKMSTTTRRTKLGTDEVQGDVVGIDFWDASCAADCRVIQYESQTQGIIVKENNHFLPI